MGLLLPTWEKVDETLIALFTRLSHRCQQLTGRTNFFLAKTCLASTSITPLWCFYMSIVVRWDPILFLLGIAYSSISVIVFIDMYHLDEEESNLYAGSRARRHIYFSIVETTSAGRASGLLFLAIMTFWCGYFDSSKMWLVWPLGLCTASYFLAVHPLPPGQSKVEKLVEQISAGINKIQRAES
ncbi:MAG: hypothetical protein A3C84_04910 [Candidatus Ryanbacteria bacterium RIFCSPHIGHO2_02_FULL_48_12]|uniref:Uncharacterized protein n=1 Tax=Candidatus Ryanbacteria bacterium RIFCSPHIGHO2_01_FULL_48_27 TaxID=1802115 RepID=A0A1G2G7W8_9BACT|nr:MAG: hypothetical protein A2756_06215 [Candidatus Ryanbacteria bacterium RIFCSPHIGHO2_01_FULL_48_27]OGZ49510.1 MAG: hypothetical protein A3C84_04910 [Candidatus Ryanbacteria bacterium RIFCSPHIGHO2_02_FULL_48_12]